MLCVGNPVFLLIPSASKKRILHPGEVIESDSMSFVGRFDEPIAPPVDSDVNAFCEINGKFFQQGAVVTELRPGPGNIIAFRRAGEPVSAEARQTYRVSVVGAEFTAKIGKLNACSIVDISPEGFAAIVSEHLNLGSVINIKLTAEGQTVSAPARVQTVKERSEHEFRYGFLVPRANIPARKSLQLISAEMQRLQLKRLRGAA
jgi:PilZ domain